MSDDDAYAAYLERIRELGKELRTSQKMNVVMMLILIANCLYILLTGIARHNDAYFEARVVEKRLSKELQDLMYLRQGDMFWLAQQTEERAGHYNKAIAECMMKAEVALYEIK